MGIHQKMSGPWIWNVLEPFRAVALSSVTVWWKSCVSEVSAFSSGQAVQDFPLCYTVSPLPHCEKHFPSSWPLSWQYNPFSGEGKLWGGFLYASILINFSKKMLCCYLALCCFCTLTDLGKFVCVSVGCNPKKQCQGLNWEYYTVSKIVILCTSLQCESTSTSNLWLDDPVILHKFRKSSWTYCFLLSKFAINTCRID